MSDIKKGSYFLLSEKTKERIVSVAEENGISNGEALTLMVNEYYKDKEEEHKILIKSLSMLLDEKLNVVLETLNKVWVTGNVIDRDTKMMMEFWNHYFFVHKFDAFATTEKYKMDELVEAEQLVKKRIAENRQRKLEWEEKKKQKAEE